MIEIGHRGYHFTGLILREWTHVQDCLRDGLIDVVVDGHDEHRPQTSAHGLAPVVSLDRQRSETTTRRLPRNDGRHQPDDRRHDNTGMTTGRVRRIIAGEEPAPAEIDPKTVAAVRSIASKLWILEHLEEQW